MEVLAIGKFLRVPADKARIMARNIIGRSVETAINTLSFSPNKTSYLLLKVLKSAVANAAENKKISDIDELFVHRVYVDRGPMLKRFQPCAHGRAKPILKRLSHITVIVKNREN
jgi:large subunit ribosomal protein L22